MIENFLDLSVCIVNYKVSQKVDELLTILESTGNGELQEYLLVDNASSDGITGVAVRHPDVKLICNAENRYFTAADNQNLARAKGRYVVSLNPDTLPCSGALDRLRTYLEEHPDVGAVMPKFVYPDGRIQFCLGHFPTLAFGILEAAGLNLVLPWNQHNKAMWPEALDYDPDVVQDAEVLYGACIMVRREVLEKVGLKDEHLVHGWDEYDWCRRIAAAGWKMKYVPDAVVIHHQGASRPFQEEGILAHYHWKGFFYLYRKHYGWWVLLLLKSLYAMRPVIMSRVCVRFCCLIMKWKGKPDLLVSRRNKLTNK